MSSMWLDLMGAEVRYVGRRHRTRVITAGDGPALVLLHGVGGHAEAWSRNVVRLSRHFRVLAIDLLWHGHSAKPPYVDGEDIPAYAEQIVDLLDTLDEERAHLEGESLGGWIGLWLALHHPDRLDRLVLNTTAGIRFEPGVVPERPKEGRELLARRSLEAIAAPTPETIRKRLEWLMADPSRVTDELVDVRLKLYADPEVRESLRAVFQNAFGGTGAPRKLIPEAQLAEVRAPTLVLWTEKNPGTGPEVGQYIADRIPGARFACIDDAAHWPQWERPDVHDSIVTDFLLAPAA